MGAEAPDLKCRPRTNSTAKSYRGDHHAWRCTGSTTLKKRIEIEQAAFTFDKRCRDRRTVRMELVPVATERALAEAIYSLVGRFSGRETGSISTLEAVLPEAVATEAVTPEAVMPEAVAAEALTPEGVAAEALTPEAVAAEALTPEGVAALKMAAPQSAMTVEPDFRETLGRGRLEVVANRYRCQQRRVAGRNRLGCCRLQDSQDAQEEAQGQTHRAEYSVDRHGGLRGEGIRLRHSRFLPSLSASCLLAATACA